MATHGKGIVVRCTYSIPSLVFAAILTMAVPAHAARQASFDCDLAKAPIEKLICGDDEMAGLDRDLGVYYGQLRSSLPEQDADALRGEQRAWLKHRLALCNIPKRGEMTMAEALESRSCLERIYRARNEELVELNVPGDSFDDGMAAYQAEDFATAHNIWLTLAEYGDAEAMYWMGELSYYGYGVEQNYQLAAYWYEMAAEFDHSEALYSLGWMNDAGEYFAPDPEQALYWYERAAEQGDTVAMDQVERLRGEGYGSGGVSVSSSGCGDCGRDFDNGMAAYDAEDYATAYDVWLPLAENGDAEAMYLVGGLFYWGRDPFTQDFEKAAAWYERAAQSGHGEAAQSLGYMYRDGNGFEIDLGAALRWFDLAAAHRAPPRPSG
jgi:hypothetical protein